jgi:uncharacterized lipoprotein YajG
MKMRVLFSLLFVMAVAGCKAPQKPVINDDTIETSQVNGVTLTHRHAVTPPTEFTRSTSRIVPCIRPPDEPS